MVLFFERVGFICKMPLESLDRILLRDPDLSNPIQSSFIYIAL